MELILFIIAAAFAFWGWKLAKRRGFQPILGAVAGFFLQPFGIILLYLLPSKLPSENLDGAHGNRIPGTNIQKAAGLTIASGALLGFSPLIFSFLHGLLNGGLDDFWYNYAAAGFLLIITLPLGFLVGLAGIALFIFGVFRKR